MIIYCRVLHLAVLFYKCIFVRIIPLGGYDYFDILIPQNFFL